LKNVLFIGLVWPEPKSTAAGVRMMHLLEVFKKDGYKVVFCSASTKTERSVNLNDLCDEVKQIQLNSASFQEYVKSVNPNVVVFDRFITEEQYGWRVLESAPKALRILDSEDLHFVRAAREMALKRNNQIDFYSDKAKREIASILRCDLTLIISEWEYDLLENQFKLPTEKLFYLPLIEELESEEKRAGYASFEEKEGFMTIGNFRHSPNLDSVKYLKTIIWPEIKRLMPEAKINVYGSYITEQALEWNSVKDGFILKGAIDQVDIAFKKARVCLAPLRYGAGIKGKLITAMKYGVPNISSTIGAEGIKGSLNWPGYVTNDPIKFSEYAVNLYHNQTEWVSKRAAGYELITKRFSNTNFSKNLLKEITKIENELSDFRKRHFLTEILNFHTMRSTEYLSRWINEKNKK